MNPGCQFDGMPGCDANFIPPVSLRLPVCENDTTDRKVVRGVIREIDFYIEKYYTELI